MGISVRFRETILNNLIRPIFSWLTKVHRAFILLIIVLGLGNQGCFSPEIAGDGGSESSGSSSTGSVSMVPSSKTIGTKNSYKFGVTGGSPPYTFSITAGSGTIDPSSGKYTAPTSTGSATLKVTDANGLSATADITIILRIPQKFSNSKYHNCVLYTDGTVKCWGYNNVGQLGIGDTESEFGDERYTMGDELPYVSIGTGLTVNQIATGGRQSCALLSDNSVKCWGDAFYGQIGQGDQLDLGDEPNEMGDNLTAIDLGTGKTATAVATGNLHSCAILNDATLKCWGRNGNGRLGLGDTSNRGDGPGEMGDSLPTVDLGTGRTAKAISLGDTFTCAILDDDSVKCWGYNWNGQLGQGDQTERGSAGGQMGDALLGIDLGTGRTAKSITTGRSHACAILDDDSVKCWGYNSFGELGQGDSNHRGDGAGEMGDALLAIDLGTGRTALSISAGYDHTCALLDNSTVKCWGRGSDGQLGHEDTTSLGDDAGEMGDALNPIDLGTGRSAKAVEAHYRKTCVLLDNDTVKCWGDSSTTNPVGTGASSDIGRTSGDMGDNLETIKFGTNLTAAALSVGYYATQMCVKVKENSALKCWGSNTYGKLGLGDLFQRGYGKAELGAYLQSVDLGTNATAIDIASGDDHTCVVLSDGRVKCWGSGDSGQLGKGDTNNLGLNPLHMGDYLLPVDLGTALKAVNIASKANLSCVRFENGSVKCWGWNSFGSLGQGHTDHMGDDPNEMGSNLSFIDLGTGRSATKIDVGDYHACALLDNSSVKCWGLNDEGELGLGDVLDRGDGPGEMGDALPAVDLGTGRTAVDIALGRYHSCALLDNGNVKCWGDNLVGSLGQGHNNDIGDGPGEMGDALPAVDLGTGRTAVQVDAGDNSTCALLDNGDIKCWGSNNRGQEGQGDTTSRGDGAGEMGDALPAIDLGIGLTVKSIHVAPLHVCAIFTDNSVKCWGEGNRGKLAVGHENNLGDDAGEMGDNLPFTTL